MINIETYSQLPNMCQSRDIGLDILYCGKWKKISNFKFQKFQKFQNNQCRTRLSYFHILQNVLQVSSGLKYIDRQTDRQTPTHTHRQTLVLYSCG